MGEFEGQRDNVGKVYDIVGESLSTVRGTTVDRVDKPVDRTTVRPPWPEKSYRLYVFSCKAWKDRLYCQA